MAWGEDMSWVALLNPGDVVFLSNRHGLERHTVSKVTAKQIVVGEYRKFRRDDGREIGQTDRWWVNNLEKCTPELDRRYRAQKARAMLRGVQWSKLSDDAVIEIVALVTLHAPMEAAK